jgi:hypothetical protein
MAMMLNPTGGLIYHLRAARYSKSLWMPFRTAVGSWLQGWNPMEKKVIVIGASGGYILPAEFLGRFDEVIAIDPDPLAHWIFRWRFRSLPGIIRWDSKDHFHFPETSTEAFRNLLASEPQAAVLFSNIWGQIAFLMEDETKRDRALNFWQGQLPKLLADRNWASYHDRYSGTDAKTASTWFASNWRLNVEELIRRFYPKIPEGVWVDHLTAGLFLAEQHCNYFLWHITPQTVHIIESIHNP